MLCKRIILGVFVFAVFALMFAFGKPQPVKADTPTITLTEGAQIRTANPTGLKFTATVSGDFSNEAVYGFALLRGEVSRDSMITQYEAGTTAHVEVEPTDGVLSVTIIDLENELLVKDFSVLAFAIDGANKYYSSSVVTRNIAEIAIAAKNDGQGGGIIDEVVSSSTVTDNFKKVTKLYNGSYLVGNVRYEYDIDAIAEEFLNDYNTVMGTSFATLVGWAKDIVGAYGGGDTEEQVKSNNLYVFFKSNDDEMLTKWGWLLDILKVTSSYNDYLVKQINTMRGTYSTWGDWWGCRHLASRLEGFLSKTRCTTVGFSSEYYGDRYRNYYDQLINSTLPSSDMNNTYKIGDSFILGANVVTRTGYYYEGYTCNEVNYNVGDSFVVTAANKIIKEAEHATVYSITYYDGENLVEGKTPVSYTIENAVELPALESQEYQFLGWCVNSNLSDNPVFSFAAGNYGDKTFYAKWGPLPVNVVARVGETGYETIQAAIDAASAGGTVTVLPGTYLDDITINKSLTLTTANATYNPTQSLSRFTNAETKVVMNCKVSISNSNTLSNIAIRGFTFTGDARIGEFNTGDASTRYISGFTFENNYVYDTSEMNVTYKHVAYNNAGYNSTSLYNNVPGFIALAGVYSWSKNPQIINNVFNNVRNIAYYTICCQGLTFTGNVLKDCYGAVRADYSSTQGTLNINDNSFENIKYSAIHLRSYGGSSLTMNVQRNYFKNVAYNATKYFNSSYIGIISTNGYGEKTAATFNVKYNVMEGCGGYINIRSNVTNVANWSPKTYVANVQYNAFIDNSTPMYNRCYSTSDNATTNYAIGNFSNNFYGSSTTDTVAINASQFENCVSYESESAYANVEALSTAVAGLNPAQSLGVLSNLL